MTSQYRHRRTSNPATPAPTLEPGEIAVNTANRQLHLGDAASATLGTPKALLAIRFFDTAAIYAVGDLVIQAGKGYRAIVANGPGAFNIAQWELSGAQLIISTTPPVAAGDGTLWWNNSEGVGKLYVRYNDGNSVQWVEAAPQPATNQFVQKAGDTMTGPLAVNSTIRSTGNIGSDGIITAGNTSATGSYYFGNTGGKLLNYDGNAFSFTGGPLLVNDGGAIFNGGVSAISAAATGTFYFGNGVSRYLNFDGTNFNLVGGALLLPGATAAQQALTRQTIAAAPVDALAYSGMQINGSMEVSQELGADASMSIPPSTLKYICDGWSAAYTHVANTMNLLASQTKSLGGPASNLQNCIILQANPAMPVVGGDDIIYFAHYVEGYRWSRLSFGVPYASPVTIGFYVNASVPGTASLVLSNPPGTASYVTNFTVNSAGTWEYKTITIPGATAAAWDIGNTCGATLLFIFAVGANSLTTTPNAWVATPKYGTAANTNFYGTDGHYVCLTGVTIIPGAQAPTAAQLPQIMRPYDQELVLCKRYFQNLTSVVLETAVTFQSIMLPVAMRTAPTIRGGGVGFVTYVNDGYSIGVGQTTREFRTLTLDARF